MAAFLHLNEIQHQRICYSGLQTALENNRQTAIQIQEIENLGLKRKLAQMEKERDHFRDHCSDLHETCNMQQENLSSAKSKIVDAIENVGQLQDMMAKKHKDCPQAVAKVIADLDLLDAELEVIVDSDGDENEPESGPESEGEAPLDEADIPINGVVVPPAN